MHLIAFIVGKDSKKEVNKYNFLKVIKVRLESSAVLENSGGYQQEMG